MDPLAAGILGFLAGAVCAGGPVIWRSVAIYRQFETALIQSRTELARVTQLLAGVHAQRLQEAPEGATSTTHSVFAAALARAPDMFEENRRVERVRAEAAKALDVPEEGPPDAT